MTLKLHSPDLTCQNIAKIAELFPNVLTEHTDEHGNTVPAIDFELLRQELSSSIVEGSQERYRLDWVGKREAILTANRPIYKTLRPYKDESVQFDTTQNLFIEGDNLDALKLLQDTYLGAVKMIYIDPPYNTGNDFIYNDDFATDSEDYLAKSEQYDDIGNRLTINTESNGRFHSDWLSMMYARLKLARNLLADDGVIFISIDDNEQANLKRLCDEVFGVDNFVANIAVEISKTQGMKVKSAQNGNIVKNHEYILSYARDSQFALQDRKPLYDKADVWDNHFNSVIIEKNGVYEKLSITDYIKSNNHEIYDIFKKYNLIKSDKITVDSIEKGIIIDKNIKKYFYEDIANLVYQEMACSISIPSNIMAKLKSGEIIAYDKYLLNLSSGGSLRQYRNLKETLKINNEYFSEYSRVTIRGALWKGFYSDMMNVAKEGNIDYKNGKKPVRLIKQLLEWLNRDNAIVLDFFAGSATTAHAVMQLNAEDGGNRKFIMVQLPEPTDVKSEAHKAGFATIAEISKERIRRAGAKISTDHPHVDTGFRVLKIDSSNMKDVYYQPHALTQADLVEMTSHIKDDRTDEDLLFQVMLDFGVPLSLPIDCRTIDGQNVYFVAGNSLVACFDGLSTTIVDEVAKVAPLRFVSSERAIAHDQDKTNIKERFGQLSAQTDVRFI